MAWNGSGGYSKQPKKAPRKATGGVSLFHGIVALVAIVVVGAVAYLFVSNDTKPAVEKKQPKAEEKAIEVVEPEIAERVETPVVEEKPKKPKEDIRTLPDGRLMKYRPDGSEAWLYPRKPLSAHPVTNGLNRVKTFEEQVFTKRSDIEIAWLMNTEIGESLVGDWDYSRRFEKDFLESLKEPIVIDPEDDEQTRILKETVKDVRADLLARYNKGEDIAQVMADTRRELQELGAYRDEVQEEVRKILKSGEQYSAKDVQDLMDAANQMLEDKGVKPIEMPAFFKHKLMKYSQMEE